MTESGERVVPGFKGSFRGWNQLSHLLYLSYSMERAKCSITGSEEIIVRRLERIIPSPLLELYCGTYTV